MNIASLYAELVAKIGRVRRKEHAIGVQTGLLNSMTAFVAVWTLAITLEVIGEFDISTRTPLYWSAVALSASLIAWLAGLPLARYLGLLPAQDDETIARRVGSGIPEVGDRLLNTLQLYRTADAGLAAVGFSPELLEASIVSQGEPLRQYDYSVIIEDDDRRRALLFFLSAIIMMGSLFLGFPAAYRGALYRLAHYNQEFVKPAPFTLSIEPGDRQLIRGDSVAVTVRAEGIPPRTVMLYTKSEGEESFEEVELRADTTGAFHYMLPNLKATTRYYAASGPVRTAVHKLEVAERPEIRLLHVTLAFPGYTGRGAERLPDNVGDASGIRGTGVNIQVTTNVPPARATIVQLFPKGVQVASAEATAIPRLYDTVRVPMSVNGTQVSGGFRLARNGEYYISVASADGLSNLSPVHYSMSVSTDGPPSIALIRPNGTASADQTMLVPTEVQISDDYGFSRLALHYRLAASKFAEPWKEFKSQSVPIPRGAISSLDVPYIWNMGALNLVPEDDVEIYFEVFDNDAVTGPKSARTGVVKIHLPSLEEVLHEADQTQNQANADIDKALRQAQDAKKQMEDLNRELMKQLAQNKQQAGWQEQQKLQELMQQHGQMQQKLEQIAENLQDMAEKLQQAKAISPETLQKYMEVQKLFENLKNTELMKSMEKLQQAMQKMTPEQMAEAMKNYKFNEEQFRQAIERTMNILKRMQTEQKVDEMIRRAEELAKQQESLNKEMAKTESQDKEARQQLAEQQKDLSKDAEQLDKETKDLSKQMNEQGDDMPNKEMQDAQESLQQDDPGGHMDQAGEKMEQGDMQQAQQQGKQAQQSAENFKKKMQGVKQKMQENSQRNVTNKMRKALQDMLDMSKREEDLKQKTDQTQPNSQQFRDLAQQQSQMEQQMENLANQMSSLSQKSFSVTPEMGREMGDAMREMQGATGSLEQRDGFNASQKEGQAMGSMNRAAMMMQQALAQMEGGQQGQGQGMGQGMGSFQQRLQQLAAQQQMINMAMGQQGQQGQQGQGQQGQNGKDGKNGQGQGGEQEGKNNQDQMGRLTNQQGQVKKSLDELNKEMREQGGTRKNSVGDLERAAKEIEEVLSDMRSGQLTPQTLERQQRILSRLLDASRSQRERDFEKERESKSGTDVVRDSPGPLDLKTDQAQNQLQRDMIRSREQGYTKDYEYMIRQYFEALQRSGGGAGRSQ